MIWVIINICGAFSEEQVSLLPYSSLTLLLDYCTKVIAQLGTGTAEGISLYDHFKENPE